MFLDNNGHFLTVKSGTNETFVATSFQDLCPHNHVYVTIVYDEKEKGNHCQISKKFTRTHTATYITSIFGSSTSRAMNE